LRPASIETEATEMRIEPPVKRCIAFVDGQNLFYAAKQAFGYNFPNYDVQALSRTLCLMHGWRLESTRFYTGIPSAKDSPKWNHFWTAKLAVMGTRGTYTFTRHLKYRDQTVALADGSTTVVQVGQEKGIDVRIALDIVRLARSNDYDVALVFSQDQDLSEAVDEVKDIAREQNRWIRVACAFPYSPAYTNRRGINGTDWLRIDQCVYNPCIDPIDYRKGR